MCLNNHRLLLINRVPQVTREWIQLAIHMILKTINTSNHLVIWLYNPKLHTTIRTLQMTIHWTQHFHHTNLMFRWTLEQGRPLQCDHFHGISHTYAYKERRTKLYACEECGNTTDQPESHYLHLKQNHPYSPALAKFYDKDISNLMILIFLLLNENINSLANLNKEKGREVLILVPKKCGCPLIAQDVLLITQLNRYQKQTLSLLRGINKVNAQSYYLSRGCRRLLKQCCCNCINCFTRGYHVLLSSIKLTAITAIPQLVVNELKQFLSIVHIVCHIKERQLKHCPVKVFLGFTLGFD
uniref:Uncharacterized protein n=1 Tax=Tetranychus urticae TaxID=32264 RepID=T1KIU2_TETUR